MTNPILNRVLIRLSPTGRQGRQAFLLNVLAIWVVMLVLNILFGLIGLNVVGSAVGALALLMTGLQMVKRLHDFDRSAWHLLCFLIPIWHLYEWFKLLFVRGHDAPNDYDPYP